MFVLLLSLSVPVLPSFYRNSLRSLLVVSICPYYSCSLFPSVHIIVGNAYNNMSCECQIVHVRFPNYVSLKFQLFFWLPFSVNISRCPHAPFMVFTTSFCRITYRLLWWNCAVLTAYTNVDIISQFRTFSSFLMKFYCFLLIKCPLK